MTTCSAGAVVGVGGHVGWEHLEGVTTRQPRMLDQINLTHAPDPSSRMILYPAKVVPLPNGIG
jgi:hypothetical protein